MVFLKHKPVPTLLMLKTRHDSPVSRGDQNSQSGIYDRRIGSSLNGLLLHTFCSGHCEPLPPSTYQVLSSPTVLWVRCVFFYPLLCPLFSLQDSAQLSLLKEVFPDSQTTFCPPLGSPSPMDSPIPVPFGSSPRGLCPSLDCEP